MKPGRWTGNDAAGAFRDTSRLLLQQTTARRAQSKRTNHPRLQPQGSTRGHWTKSSSGLRLEEHPDKTFIERVRTGFDFLGYHFSPMVLTVAAPTRALRPVNSRVPERSFLSGRQRVSRRASEDSCCRSRKANLTGLCCPSKDWTSGPPSNGSCTTSGR